MKGIVFNAGLAGGILFVGVGVGLELGTGWGLAVAGALVLGMTIYIARVAGVKASR